MKKFTLRDYKMIKCITQDMTPMDLYKDDYDDTEFDDSDIDNLIVNVVRSQIKPVHGQVLKFKQIYYNNDYPNQDAYVLGEFKDGNIMLIRAYHYENKDGFGVEVQYKYSNNVGKAFDKIESKLNENILNI